jgi:two-component system alkaline phosphatase synthesis response regulator PhoP
MSGAQMDEHAPGAAAAPGGLAAANGAARILLVEDDSALAAGISENLRTDGYLVDVLQDGRAATQHLEGAGYDLLVLDVMLPGCSGFDICRALRARGGTTPVIFLTARGDPEDRIRGLEAGGDDYLTKPFHLKEFLLRVRAILRRWEWYRGAPEAGQRSLEFGGNIAYFDEFRATSRDGMTHELTEKEAMILKLLAESNGRVVSRDELVERVWGYEIFPSTRTVDNFILRLRKRFERDPANPRHFRSVRGVGYRFDASGDSMVGEAQGPDAVGGIPR